MDTLSKNEAERSARVFALASEAFNAAMASDPMVASLKAEGITCKAQEHEANYKLEEADRVMLRALEGVTADLTKRDASSLWRDAAAPLAGRLLDMWQSRQEREFGFLVSPSAGAWRYES